MKNFIEFVTKKTGVDPEVVKGQLEICVELLKEYMEENECLTIKNLGKFTIKRLEPGMVVNPRTGELVHSDGWKRIILKGNKNSIKGE